VLKKNVQRFVLSTLFLLAFIVKASPSIAGVGDSNTTAGNGGIRPVGDQELATVHGAAWSQCAYAAGNCTATPGPGVTCTFPGCSGGTYTFMSGHTNIACFIYPLPWATCATAGTWCSMYSLDTVCAGVDPNNTSQCLSSPPLVPITPTFGRAKTLPVFPITHC